MVYEGGHTLAARAGCEMMGSLCTCILALGSVANALLPRTKGEGMGLLAIAVGVGLGVGLPIAMFFRVSAYFNPGILLAFTVLGRVGGAGAFFALLGAELAGWFAGAVVLYAFYLPHINSAVQLPGFDEVDRLLLDPAKLSEVALMNASYTLSAPAVTSPRSYWLFALNDTKQELGRALRARKVADPFQTCPENFEQACDQSGFSKLLPDEEKAGAAAASPAAGKGTPCGVSKGRQGQPDDDAAPTYAQRLHAQANGSNGPPSRGQLAAVLCKARQDILLSVFVTRPAVWSPLFNLLQEFVAMTVMATSALLLFEQGRYLGAAGAIYPTQAALYVGLLNAVVVLALGGATGPAMNPARDLGPRLAFHLLPIPGKGRSEWHYGWIPVVGGLAGGAAAGGLVAAIRLLLD